MNIIRTSELFMCGRRVVVQNINWETCRSCSIIAYFLLMTKLGPTMLTNNILAFRYVNVLVIALLALLLLLSVWFVIKKSI